MKQLLLQYTVVGGMPDAVQTFVNNKQMDDVLRIQRDIVCSYEDDMVNYAERKDKSRIRECFQSIPRQLAKENKKFQYSVVRKGSFKAIYMIIKGLFLKIWSQIFLPRWDENFITFIKAPA